MPLVQHIRGLADLLRVDGELIRDWAIGEVKAAEDEVALARDCLPLSALLLALLKPLGGVEVNSLLVCRFRVSSSSGLSELRILFRAAGASSKAYRFLRV